MWAWRVLFLASIPTRDCEGFNVLPDSVDVFSTQPEVIVRNLTLQNPSNQSIQARIQIRLATASRRLERSVQAFAQAALSEVLLLQNLGSEANNSSARKALSRRAQNVDVGTQRRKSTFGGQKGTDVNEEKGSVKATTSTKGTSQCTNEAHRLLIRLRDQDEGSSYSTGDMRRRLQSDEDLGVKVWSHLAHMQIEIAELGCEPSSLKAQDVLERLRARYGNDLLFSEVDQRVQLIVSAGENVRQLSAPSDPRWGFLWGMQRVKVVSAWDYISSLGLIDPKPVIVAVIDTGVNLQHEDLRDVIWTNSGEIPGNGIDDDHNGFIDDIHGYDFSANDGDPTDEHGHGSHCAGIIAALANNGVGIAGVAGANAKPKVMALRFIDASGSGRTSDALKSLDYAIANGAQISSNSWGGGGYSAAFQAGILAAKAAGHLLVIAAGNDGSDNDLTVSYPCGYTDDNIVCVAATTNPDALASYSNFGQISVDIAAPGSSIYSTYGGDISSYATLSGTSMAAPHVTGALVLGLSAFGSLSTNEVKDALLESAERLPWLEGFVATGGLLDVEAMVWAAAKLSWLQLLFTPEGTPTISLDVDIAADTNLSVSVQCGREPFLVGNYSTDIEISWVSGSQVVSTSYVHVSYIQQGWPELVAPWNATVLDFGEIGYQGTQTQELLLENTGNGTARYILSQRVLPSPFVTSLADGVVREILPFSTISIDVGCKPVQPGVVETLFVLSTSSGLEPEDSLRTDSVQRGSPLVLTLRCKGSAPFVLELERFSGAALLGSDGMMSYIEPSVPAVWETTLGAGSVDAELVFASATNALGCMSFPLGSLEGVVVLVERGTCSFAAKAQNAQSAGALGILIADSDPVTTISLMSMAAGMTPPAIPCFLFSRKSYLELKNKSSEDTQLRVALRWAPIILSDGPPDRGLVRKSHGSLRMENRGEVTMFWTAKVVLGWANSQSQFYQAAFDGEQVGESNYSRPPPVFRWSSLGSDTELQYLLNADDASVEVQLPFLVSFYGESFSSLLVSSNGLLVFGEFSAADEPYGSIPSMSPPNGLLAPYWDDLVCDGPCRIRVGLGQGSIENFVVQFENLRFYNDGPGAQVRLSFEVQLFVDGRFSIMYRDFPSDSSARSSLCIGIETTDGNFGVNLRASLPFGFGVPFAVELVPWFSISQDTFVDIPGLGNLLWNFTLNGEMTWETADRQGWLILNARDATSSITTRRQVRLVESGFRYAFWTGSWGPCLTAQCLGASESDNFSSQSRDAMCIGSDGSNYSIETCLNASTCRDYPSGWKDSMDNNCENYRTRSWCTSEGGYGLMWTYGNFSNYAVGGYTAATACCSCGGGVKRFAPCTVQVCTTPETCPISSNNSVPTPATTFAPTNLPTLRPTPTSEPTSSGPSTPAIVRTLDPTIMLTWSPSAWPTFAPTTSATTDAPTSVPEASTTITPSFPSTDPYMSQPTVSRQPTTSGSPTSTNALTSGPTTTPTTSAPAPNPNAPTQLPPTFEPSSPLASFPPQSTTLTSSSWPIFNPISAPSDTPTWSTTIFPVTLTPSEGSIQRPITPTLAPTSSFTPLPTSVPTLDPASEFDNVPTALSPGVYSQIASPIVTIVSQTQTLESSLVLGSSDALPETVLEVVIQMSVAKLIEVSANQVTIMDMTEAMGARRLKNDVLNAESHSQASRRLQNNSPTLSFSNRRVRFEVDFVVAPSIAPSALLSVDMVNLSLDHKVELAMQRLRIAQTNTSDLRSVLVNSLVSQGLSSGAIGYLAVDTSPIGIRSGTSRWISRPCGPCESLGVALADQCMGTCRGIAMCVISNLSNMSGSLEVEMVRPVTDAMCGSLQQPFVYFRCDLPSCVQNATRINLSTTAEQDVESKDIVLVCVSITFGIVLVVFSIAYLCFRRLRARRRKLAQEHSMEVSSVSLPHGSQNTPAVDEEHQGASLSLQPLVSAQVQSRGTCESFVFGTTLACKNQVDEVITGRAEEVRDIAIVAGEGDVTNVQNGSNIYGESLQSRRAALGVPFECLPLESHTADSTVCL